VKHVNQFGGPYHENEKKKKKTGSVFHKKDLSAGKRSSLFRRYFLKVLFVCLFSGILLQDVEPFEAHLPCFSVRARRSRFPLF